jgi:GR25 family glycosyltransferase involved in LPS biosynthesis
MDITLYILIGVAAFIIVSTLKIRLVKELFLNLAFDIPVYLISLEEDYDRRDALFSIVTPNNVSSTNGRILNKDELIKNGIVQNKDMKLGEYGCYMSHVNILEKISLDKNNDVSLVLEDDAEFVASIVSERINEIIENFNKDWDVICLGYNYHEILEDSSDIVLSQEMKLKRIKYLHGTQGYLVNNKNAYKYKDLLPIIYPYDLALPKGLKTFILEPPVIQLSKFGGKSNTQSIN